MVTIEQGGGQFQGTGGATQTQNPQQAPGNLQPNGAQGNNLQSVISGTNLFSNPQSNAIITVPKGSGSSIEALVAADTDTNAGKSTTSGQTAAFITIVALLLMVGAFLIIRKLTSEH